MQAIYRRHRIKDLKETFNNQCICDLSEQTDREKSKPLSVDNSAAVINGEQKFAFCQTYAIPIDADLTAISRIVAPFFEPQHMLKKTVLEIGNCSIYHSLKALEAGASSCIVHGNADVLLEQVSTARHRFGLSRLHSVNTPVEQIRTRFDGVIALSSSDCHSELIQQCGGITPLLIKLAQLTRGFCLLRWTNSGSCEDAFSEQKILELLRKYFSKADILGSTEKAVVFIAFASKEAIFFSDEFAPLVKDVPLKSAATIRMGGQSKTHSVYTFDCGDHWFKQYSSNGALHIAQAVKALPDGCAPEIIDLGTNGAFSYIRLQKVGGLSTDTLFQTFCTEEIYARFAMSLLRCVDALRCKGFVHAKLTVDNVTVSNGKALIHEFDNIERYIPHSCSSPDLRSAGELLRLLNAGRFEAFHKIEELMLVDRWTATSLLPGDLIHLMSLVGPPMIEPHDSERRPDLISKLLSITCDLNEGIRQRECRMEFQSNEIDKREADLELQSEKSNKMRSITEEVLSRVAQLEAERNEIKASPSWRVAIQLQQLSRKVREPITLLSSRLFSCRTEACR